MSLIISKIISIILNLIWIDRNFKWNEFIQLLGWNNEKFEPTNSPFYILHCSPDYLKSLNNFFLGTLLMPVFLSNPKTFFPHFSIKLPLPVGQ
jgi:hypothetical protein